MGDLMGRGEALLISPRGKDSRDRGERPGPVGGSGGDTSGVCGGAGRARVANKFISSSGPTSLVDS